MNRNFGCIMNHSWTACFVAFFAIAIGYCSTASADATFDINMSISSPGSALVTTGGTWSGTYAGRVFEGFIPSTSTTDPGFFAPASTFASGSRIRIDFTQELLFWNGSSLAAPASGLTISTGPRSATITGTNFGGAPGIFLTTAPSDGSYHFHATWSLPIAAATGLYGVVATLGPDGATTGFTQSAPFLVTFEKGAVSNYEAGLNAMVNAALVPEPNAVVLSLAGLVAAATWLRRQKTLVCKRIAKTQG